MCDKVSECKKEEEGGEESTTRTNPIRKTIRRWNQQTNERRDLGGQNIKTKLLSPKKTARRGIWKTGIGGGETELVSMLGNVLKSRRVKQWRGGVVKVIRSN